MPAPNASGDPARAVRPGDWDALRRTVEGELLLPGSEAYEAHRAPAIALFDAVHPAAIVRCRTTHDIAAALRLARRAGLEVAVRSGGHCFAGTSSTRGMLLDVRPLRTVVVADGLAHIGAGAQLAEVYDALAVHGLTLPAGCGPSVGISGLTLGGGLGVLGRLHGLTADRLVAVEVVLADGRVRHCDAQRRPELLWCVQGGGAPGVVTQLIFRPVEAPAVSAFVVRWPFAAARAAIDAWQRWAPDAPDVVSAELRVTAPADVEVAASVELAGMVAGGGAHGMAPVEGFVDRVGGTPTMSATVDVPFRDAKRWLSQPGDGAPAAPAHPYITSAFFDRPLPSDAIGWLVDAIGEDRRPGEARELDLLPMGGAYNRVAPDATAFAHRADRFLLRCEVAVPAGAGRAARRPALSWLAAVRRRVRAHGSGRAYRSFPDALQPADHDGSNGARLTRIRRRYDPDGVFAPAARSGGRGTSVNAAGDRPG